MASPDLEQILKQAWVKLPGASDGAMRSALYDVVKEFLTDSNAWREDIQFQALASTDTYTLSPTGGLVIRLIGTWDDKGIPVAAFMQDFGVVKLLHAPENTPPSMWFSRAVKTAKLPLGAGNIPDMPSWLLPVYSQHIRDGLIGTMMASPGQSYSNSALSTYYLKRFRQGIKIAFAEVNAANLVGAQAWAFPRFAGGSQRGGVSTAWPTRAF